MKSRCKRPFEFRKPRVNHPYRASFKKFFGMPRSEPIREMDGEVSAFVVSGKPTHIHKISQRPCKTVKGGKWKLGSRMVGEVRDGKVNKR